MVAAAAWGYPGSDHKDADADADAEGDPLIPDQPASLTRRKLVMDAAEGYGFLPRPVALVVDAGPGCGGAAWPAARVLSRYLTSRLKASPGWLDGASVVELGAGTGLVSLALASSYGRDGGGGGRGKGPRITATDLPGLLPLLRENVALNGAGGRIAVAALPWGDPLPRGVPCKPDLVLAADCVYFEPAFPLLVDTLRSLTAAAVPAPTARSPMASRPPRQEVLFCYQKRRKADKRFFAQLKRWFTWEKVGDDPDAGLYRSKAPMYLLRLHRKP